MPKKFLKSLIKLLNKKRFTQRETGTMMRFSCLNGQFKPSVKNKTIKIQINLIKMIGQKLQDLCREEMTRSVNLNLIKIKNFALTK